jgi:fatty acyl-CoA reductase
LQLFGKLKDQLPKFRHKVVIVNGDCSLPGFGLETSDRRLLIEDISLVFHGAATVRFDENLRSAIATNVMGTRSVLQLAREMKKLKVTSITYATIKITRRILALS